MSEAKDRRDDLDLVFVQPPLRVDPPRSQYLSPQEVA